MHEKRTMRAVHETMGRIEVHTDRAGRICVSCMPITVEEKGPGPATRLCICSWSADRRLCLPGNGIYDSSYGRDHSDIREGECMKKIIGPCKRSHETR